MSEFHLHNEQESSRNVDLMEMINQFPEPVISHILSRVQFIQFNTECHGGCDYCGLPVIRKGSQGFSLESWERFCEQYLQLLPRTISPYWASDPLFIGSHMRDTPDKFDLSDVAAAFEKYRGADQSMYVSTVLPPNSELALARTAFTFDESVRNGTASYLSPIRISQVPESDSRYARQKKRIDRFHAHMKAMGVTKYYINTCVEIETHTHESLRRIGPLIGEEDRSIMTSRDIEPIACTNGIIIKPTGMYPVTNHAASIHSPFGLEEDKLDPNAEKFRLPDFVSDIPYRMFDLDVRGLHPYPERSYSTYDREGNCLARETVPDIARDVLTYIYAERTLHIIERLLVKNSDEFSNSEIGSIIDFVRATTERYKKNEYLAITTPSEIVEMNNIAFASFLRSSDRVGALLKDALLER